MNIFIIGGIVVGVVFLVTLIWLVAIVGRLNREVGEKDINLNHLDFHLLSTGLFRIVQDLKKRQLSLEKYLKVSLLEKCTEDLPKYIKDKARKKK